MTISRRYTSVARNKKPTVCLRGDGGVRTIISASRERTVVILVAEDEALVQLLANDMLTEARLSGRGSS